MYTYLRVVHALRGWALWVSIEGLAGCGLFHSKVVGYTCIHAHIYIYMYMYMYMYKEMCINVYAYTKAYTYAFLSMRTCVTDENHMCTYYMRNGLTHIDVCMRGLLYVLRLVSRGFKVARRVVVGLLVCHA